MNVSGVGEKELPQDEAAHHRSRQRSRGSNAAGSRGVVDPRPGCVAGTRGSRSSTRRSLRSAGVLAAALFAGTESGAPGQAARPATWRAGSAFARSQAVARSANVALWLSNDGSTFTVGAVRRRQRQRRAHARHQFAGIDPLIARARPLRRRVSGR